MTMTKDAEGGRSGPRLRSSHRRRRQLQAERPARQGGRRLLLSEGRYLRLHAWRRSISAARKAEFERAGATIIGLSPDSVSDHDKFKAKHDLTIALAADEEKKAAEAYGVWVEKSMYGRKYMGVDRSTFLSTGKARSPASGGR